MVRGTIGNNSRPLNHYLLGKVKSPYVEFSVAVDSIWCPDYTPIAYGGTPFGQCQTEMKNWSSMLRPGRLAILAEARPI